MLMARGDGTNGRTPRVGPFKIIESGITINCTKNRNNAQFQGQRGVFRTGRHLGSQESTAGNTNALKIAAGNRRPAGAVQTATTTSKKANQAQRLALFSMKGPPTAHSVTQNSVICAANTSQRNMASELPLRSSAEET